MDKVAEEDELVESILQCAWDKLLAARQDGKLPNFDTEVPAQIEAWLCEIYNTQLGTLRVTDPAAWKTKMFSIALAFRISLKTTIGLEYFMKQMNDAGKMSAVDKLIKQLETGLKKENDVKRLLR